MGFFFEVGFLIFYGFNTILNTPQYFGVKNSIKSFKTRNFIFDYDVILHQVVTHNALIKIKNDWESRINVDNSVELGVINVDTRTDTIAPFVVNQTEVRFGKGFKSMVSLGA